MPRCLQNVVRFDKPVLQHQHVLGLHTTPCRPHSHPAVRAGWDQDVQAGGSFADAVARHHLMELKDDQGPVPSVKCTKGKSNSEISLWSCRRLQTCWPWHGQATELKGRPAPKWGCVAGTTLSPSVGARAALQVGGAGPSAPQTRSGAGTQFTCLSYRQKISSG